MTTMLRCSMLAVVLSLPPSISVAQDSLTAARPGRIVGRVVDASNGGPVPGAQVTIQGRVITSMTDWSGRYALNAVPAGTYTVTVRTIGYTPKTVSGVNVPAGTAVPLDVTLTASAIEVAAVEVTAEMERGSVANALNEQRNATGVMSGVTAEQIQKSPDSDAGQAVQRVSGVTVQDGRYVFVRGLGERYTTTSLNNARIPSPEPERKVVPLDLFPSGVLEAITTSKTFTPDQPGDFSGAQVNLRTREFPLGRVWKVSASGGGNDAAGSAAVPGGPRLGSEWLGFAGNARRMPTLVRDAGTLAGKSTGEVNQIIASFRNAWSSVKNDRAPNGGFSASLGGEDPLFGLPLGYVASFTYSSTQEVRLGERRAIAAPGSGGGGSLEVQNASTGSTGRNGVLWGGLLNVNTRLGATGRLSLNNTVTHSGDNEATRLAGHNEQLNQFLEVTRLSYTERRVRSHQLVGHHLLRGRDQLEWTVTTSAVRRLEPDRSDLAYQTVIDSVTGESHPYAWFGAPRSATRTFSDVQESGWDVGASYRRTIGMYSAIKIGGGSKWMDRDADTRAYDVFAIGLTDLERQQPAEAIFNGTYAQQGLLSMTANSALGIYTAAERVLAGFGQLELGLTERLRVIGGARVESARLEVATHAVGLSDTTARLRNTDLLPAVAVQLRVGANHNLRLAASQTLSRPEYRELSPSPYFDILGGQTLRGNPGLHRARVQNFDARWEWYPSPGEVASVAVFVKRFLHPIERILIQRSDGAPEATFVNATAANNYGLELELRHGLGILTPALQPLTLFANATIMHSEIEPGNDSLSSLTNARRPMVGQSAYVVNAGLTYANQSGRLNATVLYNAVGRRISEAAIFPLPDVYDETRHLLDLSVQVPLTGQATLKVDAKNLLDSPFQFTQGTVQRLYYRAGRVFGAGITWTP